jgi:LemA protein
MEAIFILIPGFILILFFVQSAFYFVQTYNTLVKMRNDILKAWSNIDVLLKQRNDEIQNLISTVKGYMEHEQKTLIEVARARATLEAASSVGEKAASDSIIRDTLGRLFAVVENYPQLKADQAFLKLQTRLTGIENQIADRREFYNDATTIYNTRIQSIPDSFVAQRAGFGRIPLFKATEQERKKIEVAFRQTTVV